MRRLPTSLCAYYYWNTREGAADKIGGVCENIRAVHYWQHVAHAHRVEKRRICFPAASAWPVLNQNPLNSLMMLMSMRRVGERYWRGRGVESFDNQTFVFDHAWLVCNALDMCGVLLRRGWCTHTAWKWCNAVCALMILHSCDNMFTWFPMWS